MPLCQMTGSFSQHDSFNGKMLKIENPLRLTSILLYVPLNINKPQNLLQEIWYLFNTEKSILFLSHKTI